MPKENKRKKKLLAAAGISVLSLTALTALGAGVSFAATKAIAKKDNHNQLAQTALTINNEPSAYTFQQINTTGAQAISLSVTAMPTNNDDFLTYTWYECSANGSNLVSLGVLNSTADKSTLILTDANFGAHYYLCKVSVVDGLNKVIATQETSVATVIGYTPNLVGNYLAAPTKTSYNYTSALSVAENSFNNLTVGNSDWNAYLLNAFYSYLASQISTKKITFTNGDTAVVNWNFTANSNLANLLKTNFNLTKTKTGYQLSAAVNMNFTLEHINENNYTETETYTYTTLYTVTFTGVTPTLTQVNGNWYSALDFNNAYLKTQYLISSSSNLPEWAGVDAANLTQNLSTSAKNVNINAIATVNYNNDNLAAGAYNYGSIDVTPTYTGGIGSVSETTGTGTSSDPFVYQVYANQNGLILNLPAENILAGKNDLTNEIKNTFQWYQTNSDYSDAISIGTAQTNGVNLTSDSLNYTFKNKLTAGDTYYFLCVLNSATYGKANAPFTNSVTFYFKVNVVGNLSLSGTTLSSVGTNNNTVYVGANNQNATYSVSDLKLTNPSGVSTAIPANYLADANLTYTWYLLNGTNLGAELGVGATFNALTAKADFADFDVPGVYQIVCVISGTITTLNGGTITFGGTVNTTVATLTVSAPNLTNTAFTPATQTTYSSTLDKINAISTTFSLDNQLFLNKNITYTVNWWASIGNLTTVNAANLQSVTETATIDSNWTLQTTLSAETILNWLKATNNATGNYYFYVTVILKSSDQVLGTYSTYNATNASAELTVSPTFAFTTGTKNIYAQISDNNNVVALLNKNACLRYNISAASAITAKTTFQLYQVDNTFSLINGTNLSGQTGATLTNATASVTTNNNNEITGVNFNLAQLSLTDTTQTYYLQATIVINGLTTYIQTGPITITPFLNVFSSATLNASWWKDGSILPLTWDNGAKNASTSVNATFTLSPLLTALMANGKFELTTVWNATSVLNNEIVNLTKQTDETFSAQALTTTYNLANNNLKGLYDLSCQYLLKYVPNENSDFAVYFQSQINSVTTGTNGDEPSVNYQYLPDVSAVIAKTATTSTVTYSLTDESSLSAKLTALKYVWSIVNADGNNVAIQNMDGTSLAYDLNSDDLAAGLYTVYLTVLGNYNGKTLTLTSNRETLFVPANATGINFAFNTYHLIQNATYNGDYKFNLPFNLNGLTITSGTTLSAVVKINSTAIDATVGAVTGGQFAYIATFTLPAFLAQTAGNYSVSVSVSLTTDNHTNTVTNDFNIDTVALPPFYTSAPLTIQQSQTNNYLLLNQNAVSLWAKSADNELIYGSTYAFLSNLSWNYTFSWYQYNVLNDGSVQTLKLNNAQLITLTGSGFSASQIATANINLSSLVNAVSCYVALNLEISPTSLTNALANGVIFTGNTNLKITNAYSGAITNENLASDLNSAFAVSNEFTVIHNLDELSSTLTWNGSGATTKSVKNDEIVPELNFNYVANDFYNSLSTAGVINWYWFTSTATNETSGEFVPDGSVYISNNWTALNNINETWYQYGTANAIGYRYFCVLISVTVNGATLTTVSPVTELITTPNLVITNVADAENGQASLSQLVYSGANLDLNLTATVNNSVIAGANMQWNYAWYDNVYNKNAKTITVGKTTYYLLETGYASNPTNVAASFTAEENNAPVQYLCVLTYELTQKINTKAQTLSGSFNSGDDASFFTVTVINNSASAGLFNEISANFSTNYWFYQQSGENYTSQQSGANALTLNSPLVLANENYLFNNSWTVSGINLTFTDSDNQSVTYEISGLNTPISEISTILPAIQLNLRGTAAWNEIVNTFLKKNQTSATITATLITKFSNSAVYFQNNASNLDTQNITFANNQFVFTTLPQIKATYTADTSGYNTGSGADATSYYYYKNSSVSATGVASGTYQAEANYTVTFSTDEYAELSALISEENALNDVKNNSSDSGLRLQFAMQITNSAAESLAASPGATNTSDGVGYVLSSDDVKDNIYTLTENALSNNWTSTATGNGGFTYTSPTQQLSLTYNPATATATTFNTTSTLAYNALGLSSETSSNAINWTVKAPSAISAAITTKANKDVTWGELPNGDADVTVTKGISENGLDIEYIYQLYYEPYPSNNNSQAPILAGGGSNPTSNQASFALNSDADNYYAGNYSASVFINAYANNVQTLIYATVSEYLIINKAQFLLTSTSTMDNSTNSDILFTIINAPSVYASMTMSYSRESWWPLPNNQVYTDAKFDVSINNLPSGLTVQSISYRYLLKINQNDDQGGCMAPGGPYTTGWTYSGGSPDDGTENVTETSPSLSYQKSVSFNYVNGANGWYWGTSDAYDVYTMTISNIVIELWNGTKTITINESAKDNIKMNNTIWLNNPNQTQKDNIAYQAIS